MTYRSTPKFDHHAQCKTCGLGDEITREVHGLHELGHAYTHISQTLKHKHSIVVSADALSNHLRKHTRPVAGVEPVVGVVKPPKGFEARAEYDKATGVGEVVSTPQTDDQITDFSQILESFNISPDEFEIDGSARVSKWQTFYGEWLTSYKFKIRKKSNETLDLPALFQEVRSNIIYREPTIKPKNKDRTVVVPFADLQAGKVGSRGDSKILIERVTEKRYKLEEYVKTQNCGSAVFMDGGDIVESFENVAQQGFTNDLSIMDQLDLAGTIEQEFITMLARHHDEVIATGVPANHTAWRKGKDILGRPSDDWGLFLLKQIERAYQLNKSAYSHVKFHYPEDWRKSININVQGIGVGLVHGEDSSLAQMENWWAKQVHGASPIAESDILITNHYHTFGLKPTGRSMRTGRQKWWLATPTLDNGSDWWANKNGSDSDPGLVAFVVDKHLGFDLQSVTIL